MAELKIYSVSDEYIKYLRQDRKGDLYVKVHIVVPRKLTDRQRELLMEFGEMTDPKQKKKSKSVFS